MIRPGGIRRRPVRWAALGLALMALGACERLPFASAFSRAVPESPLPFDARIAAERGSAEFAVVVVARGAGLERIRESVRYQGTRYCLRTFGSSGIAWRSSGAADTWSFRRLENGRLVFTGRCVGR